MSDFHDGKCALCKRHTKVETITPTLEEARRHAEEEGLPLELTMRPVEVCQRCENGYHRMLLGEAS